MFCPNCGQENSSDQKFCRKCGLNLEKSAESLAEQIQIGLTTRELDSDRRLEVLGRLAFGGLGVVGVAAVAGMVYSILTKFILTGDGIVFGVIMILLLVFAVLGLTYVVLNENRKERKISKPEPITPNEIESPDTAKLLDTGDFQPIPSVVEDTTDLLPIKNRTRKL